MELQYGYYFSQRCALDTHLVVVVAEKETHLFVVVVVAVIETHLFVVVAVIETHLLVDAAEIETHLVGVAELDTHLFADVDGNSKYRRDHFVVQQKKEMNSPCRMKLNCPVPQRTYLFLENYRYYRYYLGNAGYFVLAAHHHVLCPHYYYYLLLIKY